MSYVESQLLPGERVQYRARLHKIVFVPAFLVALLTIGAGIAALRVHQLWIAAALGAAVTVILFMPTLIRYRTSEFAVTDRRVIMKVGWIQRRTLEVMLGKVEAIGVDQRLLGRVLNYGTITVTGTGGTHEPFPQIAAPLEFRKHVQGEAMAAEDRRAGAPSPSAGNEVPPPAPPSTVREERECPFCAERVLVRARVCRYCGRELPAVVS